MENFNFFAKKIILILLLLLSVSCSTPYYAKNPIILDHRIINQQAWVTEANKRFYDPLVVAAHGYVERLPYLDPIWMCRIDSLNKSIPVKELASILREVYPNRDIILIICNEDSLKLNIKRVWHPKKKVWQIPDSGLDLIQKSFQPRVDKDSTGSIYDFTDE